MAMLTLNGQVINVFDQPSYTDKKTGEVLPAKHRVQIMAENLLQNGSNRMELVNLTVEDITPYQKLIGRSVRVPVGAFANGSSIQFYALKAHSPEAVSTRALDGSGATPAARVATATGQA
jgi:hypothetical protein